jgi:hypothetical protein
MSALYVSVWTDQKSLIKLTASRRKVNKARKDSVLPRELFGISLRQASGPGSDADCSKMERKESVSLFKIRKLSHGTEGDTRSTKNHTLVPFAVEK